MKYLCLRNCYVNDRFHYQGETYELPDDMVKSEKNFEPMGVPEPAPEPKPKKAKPEKTRPEPSGEGFGDYLCPKCKVTHRAGSKIHKRHTKLL